MTPSRTRRWISPAECAELLGLSLSGLRKMIGRGEIACIRLGRSIRIDARRLEDGFEKQMKGSR